MDLERRQIICTGAAMGARQSYRQDRKPCVIAQRGLDFHRYICSYWFGTLLATRLCHPRGLAHLPGRWRVFLRDEPLPEAAGLGVQHKAVTAVAALELVTTNLRWGRCY